MHIVKPSVICLGSLQPFRHTCHNVRWKAVTNVKARNQHCDKFKFVSNFLIKFNLLL